MESEDRPHSLRHPHTVAAVGGDHSMTSAVSLPSSLPASSSAPEPLPAGGDAQFTADSPDDDSGGLLRLTSQNAAGSDMRSSVSSRSVAADQLPPAVLSFGDKLRMHNALQKSRPAALAPPVISSTTGSPLVETDRILDAFGSDDDDDNEAADEPSTQSTDSSSASSTSRPL